MRGDDTLGGQEGSDYQYTHRNKRSITLNLKEPEGVEVLEEAHCRPPTCCWRTSDPTSRHRLGIDYEIAVEDQSAAGLREHLGLRSDRPLRNSAGLRPDRAGNGRR